MIERGILPEGTELTPINPMRRGTFSAGDAVRPWDTLYDEEKRLFSRMAEVYAGFSRVHRPPGRPDRRLPRGVRAARQHDHLLLPPTTARRARAARTARSTRASSSTPSPTRSRTTCRCSTSSAARTPTTTTRPAGRSAFSTPYRMFKRYTYQGGVCDPLVIHWPAGIEARGEVRDAVPPLHRHRPDDPRLLRRRDARRGRRLRADAAPRRLDALLVRRRPTRRRRRRRSTTRCSARAASGTRAGRRSPSTGRCDRAWATSTRTAGSSSTPTRTGRRRTTSPTEHPEKVEELVDLWLEEAKKYDVLPLNDLGDPRLPRAGVPDPGPPERRSTRTTRARPRSRSARPPTYHGVSYKILAEVEFTDPAPRA